MQFSNYCTILSFKVQLNAYIIYWSLLTFRSLLSSSYGIPFRKTLLSSVLRCLGSTNVLSLSSRVVLCTLVLAGVVYIQNLVPPRLRETSCVVGADGSNRLS